MTTDDLARIVSINGAIQAAMISLLLDNGVIDRSEMAARLDAIEAEQTTSAERRAASMTIGLLRSYLSLPD